MYGRDFYVQETSVFFNKYEGNFKNFNKNFMPCK